MAEPTRSASVRGVSDAIVLQFITGAPRDPSPAMSMSISYQIGVWPHNGWAFRPTLIYDDGVAYPPLEWGLVVTSWN